MNAFDWIVFDSTGTLMIPDPEPAVAYAQVAASLGSALGARQIRPALKQAMAKHFLEDGNDIAPTDQDHERTRWKNIVSDSLSDLATSPSNQAFELLWDHFARADQWRLFDDVPIVIKHLRSKGYRIAIASNFDQRLSAIIRDMKIEPWFDQVLISADLGWSKPNTKFYDTATARLGQNDRARILMIGDTLRGDVVAARDSGWQARHLIRDSDGALAELTADL